jgi:hypothetical protein
LRRRAPVVAHSPEATRPGPFDATPNSCCDQNAAPVPPARSRSAAPVQPAASPLPAPSPGRLATNSRRLLNPPQGPVQTPQRYHLFLLLFAQDICPCQQRLNSPCRS